MKTTRLIGWLAVGAMARGLLWAADSPSPAAEPASAAVPAAELVVTPAVPVSAPEAPTVPAAPVSPPPKPELFRAVTVWSGAVVEVKLTSEAQKWRDMDALLKENRFKAEEGTDKPAIDRPPGEGRQYAILTMKLREKRSIGKHDYQLRVNGTDCPCLALGFEGAPFDPRVWEHKHAPGTDEVMLAFEVPAGAMEGTLVTVLPVTVPQPDATLKLAVESPPTPAEPLPAAPASADMTVPPAPAPPAAAQAVPK